MSAYGAFIPAGIKTHYRSIKVKFNARIESMDDGLWVPLPSLESWLTSLSNKRIAFYSVEAMVIPSYYELSRTWAVRKPDFVPWDEPVGVVQFEELSPSQSWWLGNYIAGHVGLNQRLE